MLLIINNTNQREKKNSRLQMFCITINILIDVCIFNILSERVV